MPNGCQRVAVSGFQLQPGFLLESPRFCRSIGDFELSHSDAEKVIGKPIPVNMWCSRMSRALEEVCRLEGSSVSRLTGV